MDMMWFRYFFLFPQVSLITQQKLIPNNSKSETVGVFSLTVTKQQDKFSSVDVFLEHQESRFL
jgi:hypothetical protein